MVGKVGCPTKPPNIVLSFASHSPPTMLIRGRVLVFLGSSQLNLPLILEMEGRLKQDTVLMPVFGRIIKE